VNPKAPGHAPRTESMDVPTAVASALAGAVREAHEAGAPSALLRVDDLREGWSWSGASGTLACGDGVPVSADASFRIASVTKCFTATLALGLVADGALALDDPLTSSPARRLVAEMPDGDRLTLRHLLAHTSGLANYSVAHEFRRRLLADPLKPWSPVELFAEVRRLGAEAAPGERFAYGDSGYVLAGLVIEKLLDTPLHEALRERILDPAGMATTWLEGHEPARAEPVTHHYDGDQDLTQITPTWDWAGGGYVSTLGDLVRFARAMIDQTVLAPGVTAEMAAWTPGARFPPHSPAQYEQYGLGLGTGTFAGARLLGHTGFVGSFVWWWPARKVILAGTTNRRGVDRRPMIEAAVRAIAAQNGPPDSPVG
jgi:D-alanyl-D-alanine carboxypeptidase